MALWETTRKKKYIKVRINIRVCVLDEDIGNEHYFHDNDTVVETMEDIFLFEKGKRAIWNLSVLLVNQQNVNDV